MKFKRVIHTIATISIFAVTLQTANATSTVLINRIQNNTTAVANLSVYTYARGNICNISNIAIYGNSGDLGNACIIHLPDTLTNEPGYLILNGKRVSNDFSSRPMYIDFSGMHFGSMEWGFYSDGHYAHQIDLTYAPWNLFELRLNPDGSFDFIKNTG